VSADHPFLRQLRQAGFIDDEPPRPVTTLPTGPTAAPGDPAAARYGQAALEAECAEVARAAEGTRNDTLNRAAYKIGQLVAAGHVGAETAWEQLRTAAELCGRNPTEIAQTVPRALRDGGVSPRQVQLNPEVGPAFTLHVNDADAAPGTIITPEDDDQTAVDPFARYQSGGQFIFDVPPVEPALWGKDTSVLWAAGEALMIVGPPGVGKTTVTQQLVLARVGLADDFLGFPVLPTRSRVLYLAMDRPRQIARSLRRMVDDGDKDLLDERLVVWPGPPPADVAKAPEMLRVLAEKAGADTLVVDSVKDAAIGLTDSETAGWYNRARQRALAAGIEVVEVAHQVKKGAAGSAPKTLADVHGGMELTAGVGSVFLVWGEAGDLVVEFRHLKQPHEMVGPLKLHHDHDCGRTTVFADDDPVVVLRNTPGREWSARDVAMTLGDGTGKPTDAAVERVRRRLSTAVDRGVLRRVGYPSTRSQSGLEYRFIFDDVEGGTSWNP